MSRNYRHLMADLARDYEHFSDIPAAQLLAPAMAWFEQQPDNAVCEALTEARQATWLKVWRHHIPRAGYELAAMRADEPNTFIDAAADVAISITLAIVEYALNDLCDAFERDEHECRMDALADRLKALRERMGETRFG